LIGLFDFWRTAKRSETLTKYAKLSAKSWHILANEAKSKVKPKLAQKPSIFYHSAAATS